MAAAVQRASSAMPPVFSSLDSRAPTEAAYRSPLERESRRSIGSAITAEGASRNDALRAGDILDVAGGLDAHGCFGLASFIGPQSGRWSRRTGVSRSRK
jgi:hypothetical protein